MLINCKEIYNNSDEELRAMPKDVVLYSRAGTQICTGYDAVVQIGDYVYFEIPIKNVYMANMKDSPIIDKKNVILYSKDKFVKRVVLCLDEEDKYNRKHGMVYINIGYLFRLIK